MRHAPEYVDNNFGLTFVRVLQFLNSIQNNHCLLLLLIRAVGMREHS